MTKQKRWRVLLTRDVTISTMLFIDADSAEEANDKALDIALDNKQILSWDLDDPGSTSEPYIADPEGTEIDED